MNKDKTWMQILDELRSRGLQEEDIWNYVTALRGPDFREDDALLLKFVFTAPLRGRSSRTGDYFSVSKFLSLSIEQVEQAFRIGSKRFSRYAHYFSHIKAAWYTLGREDISVILCELCTADKPWDEVAQRYVNAVKSWLDSEEAVEVREQ